MITENCRRHFKSKPRQLVMSPPFIKTNKSCLHAVANYRHTGFLQLFTNESITNRKPVIRLNPESHSNRKLRLKKDVFCEDDPNTTLEEVLDALTMNSKEQRIKEELTH